jgi:protein-S-isoprenylcysteine O-methyltransferase Ste14
MKIFIGIYFLVLVIQIIIRTPFERKRRQEKLRESRFTKQEQFLLTLLTLGGVIVPVIYAATHWLDFANYKLPAWAGWLGVALMAISLFVFWRGHVDLGVNWSPTLAIREQHALVTRGIYGVIRHPMYASQWIFALASPLLLRNWFAGFLNLLVFIPFYFLRVGAEEQMMLEQFGDQYRSYMRKVGAVFPKF